MQTTRGIEDDDVVAFLLRGIHRPVGNHARRLERHNFKRCHIRLLAQNFKLLLGSRAAHVERRHQDLLELLFLNALGNLGRRGRLAGALQTDHHHGGRGRCANLEFFAFGAEHFSQIVINDLDDLLTRRDRAQHFLADRTFAYAVDEILDHGQRDIGFKQRNADFPHRRRNVGLR